jgi:ribonuclease PH
MAPGFVPTADGSCLIEIGGTRVICTASFERGVPDWMVGKGAGWVTGEYGMLPASGGRRKKRPVGKPDSRATEISRLIGRTLRNVVRMDRMGENTIWLDCDVLTADGGTRTAAVTGAYVALAQAAGRLARRGLMPAGVIAGAVAAVSVGLVDGRALLDLDYHEDVHAEADVNVAMASDGRFVEIQATGEAGRFDESQLRQMLSLARRGIRKLLGCQKRAVATAERKR